MWKEQTKQALNCAVTMIAVAATTGCTCVWMAEWAMGAAVPPLQEGCSPMYNKFTPTTTPYFLSRAILHHISPVHVSSEHVSLAHVRQGRCTLLFSPAAPSVPAPVLRPSLTLHQFSSTRCSPGRPCPPAQLVSLPCFPTMSCPPSHSLCPQPPTAPQ